MQWHVYHSLFRISIELFRSSWLINKILLCSSLLFSSLLYRQSKQSMFSFLLLSFADFHLVREIHLSNWYSEKIIMIQSMSSDPSHSSHLSLPIHSFHIKTFIGTLFFQYSRWIVGFLSFFLSLDILLLKQSYQDQLILIPHIWSFQDLQKWGRVQLPVFGRGLFKSCEFFLLIDEICSFSLWHKFDLLIFKISTSEIWWKHPMWEE